MDSENKVLAIDAGNTSVKAGYFLNGELIEVKRFSLSEVQNLSEWSRSCGISKIILSSVLNVKNTKTLSQLFDFCLIVDADTPLPIPILYESPKTLGRDRVCNAAFIYLHSKTEYAVSIDMGTCIKFDLVHTSNGYIGGSISPGVDLKYKALNDYTGNLPLVSNKTMASFVGKNTSASIQAGVLNGTKAEIEGMIVQYKEQYKDLTFFMTGGDASFFDIHSKIDIFADENLTIKGLYEIYKYNA